MSILAQIADPVLNGLTTFGALGIVLAYHLYRDAKREERQAVREEKRDEKLDKLMDAMHGLTRALSLEVLTRPTVVQRTADEAREIHASAKREA